MSAVSGHKHTSSVSQNHKAQLANAYNELGKELSSTKIKVVGNYTLGKVIGEGAYGKVRLGTHRLTSTRVAIKQIPKAMSASLTREIHHHRQLHHPHVTQMYEVIATESSIWIVTELCSGGELFDYLAEKGRLSEQETRVLFGQLCLAVAYLHEKGIVHRDLKLENVLLDEHCRVKLGDFGFTREFERGSLMETFCGTTGYAAPEMLKCEKYLGPEVDIWSLGIILYCLLTGSLPFDDDDEAMMRAKIITDDYEDPEWLSTDARDLIRNILQKDSAKRPTISQILGHPWFSIPAAIDRRHSSMSNVAVSTDGHLSSPDFSGPQTIVLPLANASPMSVKSDVSFLTASCDFPSPMPVASEPDDNDPFISTERPSTPPNAPDSAAKDAALEATLAILQSGGGVSTSEIATEGVIEDATPRKPSSSAPNGVANGTDVTGGSKAPPMFPVRTPARTKRRSVSSIMSDHDAPSLHRSMIPFPPQDFSSILNTPAPIIFTTKLERNLLNSLSDLGFDTAQIVHSVLSDACDAAGALWWIMKRKSEKKLLEEVLLEPDLDSERTKGQTGKDKGGRRGVGVGVQTETTSGPLSLSVARSAPQLAFVPPTPTLQEGSRPDTPPQNSNSSLNPYLSPSSSPLPTSNASTPGSSVKERPGSRSKRESKARSGSVSIMQRANTALEAVGIVRKRSTEAMRDDKEKHREPEKKNSVGEEPRPSHGSSSSKLTKSPPLKSTPATPSVSPELVQTQANVGSPWVVTRARSASPQSDVQSRSESPGDTLTSLPNFNAHGTKVGSHRHRASLLTTFRLWFNEDRKGKRKEVPSAGSSTGSPVYGSRPLTKPSVSAPAGLQKSGIQRRRSSGSTAMKTGRNRTKRTSVSSHRSSSLNSRRSSGVSVQIPLTESPHLALQQVQTRVSIGSHTPNSENPSRPSSVRSMSMPSRHRKSPSGGSAGSTHYRASSPMGKYHRRGASNSSTRVVRQLQAGSGGGGSRPSHVRSNSAASSIQSLTSSRPASYYEPSEGEGTRTSSPFKPRSRRSGEDISRRSSGSNTTFVAQKRQTPFTSPLYMGSVSRSSWKKSWGLEPPGWQSRTTHLPIEVLAISPSADSATSLRDVFSGRQSLNMGDDSDWVDEDEDLPAFAGGLGQTPASASAPSVVQAKQEPVTSFSPSPRGSSMRGAGRRTSTVKTSGLGAPGAQNRQKPGHSPVRRPSPIQLEPPFESDSRGSRRQLPASRPGPAFKQAIQEEDEDEE